jgi:tRNA-dihydrouridine synthase 4
LFIRLDDRPLIVQFGAANDVEFSEAAKLVANVCDGVDLNCGCPQRWVAKKGFGSCLLQKPEHVAEMVKAVKRLPLGRTDSFSVSVKIRVNDDVK